MVRTTLVIGVALFAANNRAPAFPFGERVTDPRTVDPFIKSAVIAKAPKASGSISNPKFVVGVESVSVREVSEVVRVRTFGVAESVFGGEPPVLQLTPTVATVRAVESVRVWLPLTIDPTVAPFDPGIGMRAVEERYGATGVEICVN